MLKAAAIVLIGGLLTSTVLTLVFVPAMYTVFDDVEQGFVRLAHRFSTARQLAPVELAILHPQHVESFASAGAQVAGVGPSVNGHTEATPPAVATTSET